MNGEWCASLSKDQKIGVELYVEHKRDRPESNNWRVGSESRRSIGEVEGDRTSEWYQWAGLDLLVGESLDDLEEKGTPLQMPLIGELAESTSRGKGPRIIQLRGTITQGNKKQINWENQEAHWCLKIQYLLNWNTEEKT